MSSTKKKNTISRKKRKKETKPRIPKGFGVAVPGTSVVMKREYPGQDPKYVELPDPVDDIESTLPEPKDAASKHKYPPPKKHPVFRKIWMDFIDNLTGRENFKNGHLHSLEILCDLHVEYEDLRAYIRKNGRSYKSYGRSGMQWKFYPEVTQLNSVQSQILGYMKTLGLVLKKDHSTSNPGTGEKDEWS
jgi:hypothetical protein